MKPIACRSGGTTSGPNTASSINWRSATADPRTREDIRERLGLDGEPVFLASFDRPNIRYQVQALENLRSQLLPFLEQHRGASGIVKGGLFSKPGRAKWRFEMRH